MQFTHNHLHLDNILYYKFKIKCAKKAIVKYVPVCTNVQNRNQTLNKHHDVYFGRFPISSLKEFLGSVSFLHICQKRSACVCVFLKCVFILLMKSNIRIHLKLC